MKNYTKILESINNAIQFALDDFDNFDYNETNNQISDYIDVEDGVADFQRHLGQTLITQKVFIYELLKRLPNIDKKTFAPFGYVNYKVTGNPKDWPYITSLNKNMSKRIREKYQEIFDTKGWTTTSDSHTFSELILIKNDIFKNYHIYGNELRGKDAFNAKKSYWINEFKGKYDEFDKALEILAYYHPYLKDTINFWVNQISLSNDGAFIAIMYEVYKNEKDEQHVEIFSTQKIVGEAGINLQEEKDLKTKQTKFKNYLNKTILFDQKLPKQFIQTSINNHAAFSLSAMSNIDFDYRLRYHQRAHEAYELFHKQFGYNEKTYNAIIYIMYAMSGCLYIEDKYYNGIYDDLENNGVKPYILISSKDGKYLIAFYNIYKSYKEYKLVCTIIDNTDYSIMSKDYLKEIEYNPIN